MGVLFVPMDGFKWLAEMPSDDPDRVWLENYWRTTIFEGCQYMAWPSPLVISQFTT